MKFRAFIIFGSLEAGVHSLNSPNQCKKKGKDNPIMP